MDNDYFVEKKKNLLKNLTEIKYFVNRKMNIGQIAHISKKTDNKKFLLSVFYKN
jgi:hypothetical protein